MFPYWPEFNSAWQPRRWPVPETDDDRPENLALANEVADRFIADPVIRAGQVRISVQNRVVILEGTIDSPAAKAAAGRQAWATPGVHDVSNRLTTAG